MGPVCQCCSEKGMEAPRRKRDAHSKTRSSSEEDSPLFLVGHRRPRALGDAAPRTDDHSRSLLPTTGPSGRSFSSEAPSSTTSNLSSRQRKTPYSTTHSAKTCSTRMGSLGSPALLSGSCTFGLQSLPIAAELVKRKRICDRRRIATIGTRMDGLKTSGILGHGICRFAGTMEKSY